MKFSAAVTELFLLGYLRHCDCEVRCSACKGLGFYFVGVHGSRWAWPDYAVGYKSGTFILTEHSSIHDYLLRARASYEDGNDEHFVYLVERIADKLSKGRLGRG